MKSSLKKILLTSVLLLASGISVFAQKRVIIGEKFLEFKANDDFTELTITGFKSDASFKGKVIEIPAKIQGVPVTAIGAGAFRAEGKGIEGIWIPDTINRINGLEAFLWCEFKTVRLPEGIEEIPERTFWGSKIQSINIPSSVKYIKADSFASCRNLVSITIPEGATIGGHAFEDSGIKTLTFPNGRIILETPLGFKETFYRCDNLEKVVIPSGFECYASTSETTLDTFFSGTKLKSNLALQKQLKGVKVGDWNKLKEEERLANNAKQFEAMKAELAPFEEKYNSLLEAKNYDEAAATAKSWYDAASSWVTASEKANNSDGYYYATDELKKASAAQKIAGEAKTLSQMEEELAPFAQKCDSLVKGKKYEDAMQEAQNWYDAATKWLETCKKEKNADGIKYAQEAQQAATSAKEKAEGKTPAGRSKKFKKGLKNLWNSI